MRGNWFLPVIMAAIAGALMAVQGAANSMLAKRSSLAMAGLWVHGTALLALAAVLLVLPATRGSWTNLLRSPWPALLGGVMGAAITWLVATAVGPVGMVVATTGIIAAQVATATVLDHFGLLGMNQSPFSWTKGIGALLLVAGAWLMLRK